MAVHIHAFEGAGNFFDAGGADPLLLEPAFNDPALRHTNFVIIHGGGVFSAHAGAMLWKPNVYVDTSLMALRVPAVPAGRGAQELARAVSGEGAVRNRCRRVRAGYGLGGGRVDRHDQRADGARDRAHVT